MSLPIPLPSIPVAPVADGGGVLGDPTITIESIPLTIQVAKDALQSTVSIVLDRGAIDVRPIINVTINLDKAVLIIAVALFGIFVLSHVVRCCRRRREPAGNYFELGRTRSRSESDPRTSLFEKSSPA